MSNYLRSTKYAIGFLLVAAYPISGSIARPITLAGLEASAGNSKTVLADVLPASPVPSLTGPSPTDTAPLPPSGLYDTLSDNDGIAQNISNKQPTKARILWIDAGANVGNLNSVTKIADIVKHIKDAGFNMIVLDVKPIVGKTIYPSRFAERLLEWRGQKADPKLDVLAEVLKDAHASQILVYANMSTFGEGHKLVHEGLAYTHPEWQTILYEVERSVSRDGSVEPISAIDDLPKNENSVAASSQGGTIHRDLPGYTIAILNFDARVIQVYDGQSLSQSHPTIPILGSVLLGYGKAAEWLKTNARLGAIMTYRADPKYVPVQDAPEQVYTMFCDPRNAQVQQHEIDIATEIATNYQVDGIVFDDRMRFAGLNADFSDSSKRAFEKLVGTRIRWPDDIFRTSPYPGQDEIRGPYFDKWIAWRASIIHDWLQRAADAVRRARPAAQVAVYVGSWYGEYYKVGSNWAGADFSPPGLHLNAEYMKSGYAGLLDWLTTGCYYVPATIAEAIATGSGAGASVEAAGQLSNRVVNDNSWTYAGLYALSYQGKPEKFSHAISAALESTQGVMVFDMSQIIDYNWWGVIHDALSTPPSAPPNSLPDLTDDLKRQHEATVESGTPQHYLPGYLGLSGTGL